MSVNWIFVLREVWEINFIQFSFIAIVFIQASLGLGFDSRALDSNVPNFLKNKILSILLYFLLESKLFTTLQHKNIMLWKKNFFNCRKVSLFTFLDYVYLKINLRNKMLIYVHRRNTKLCICKNCSTQNCYNNFLIKNSTM